MDQAALELANEGEAGPAPASPSIAAALERIDGIGEVPLPIEVELDRKILSVRAILGLSVGSVLKLSRSAGENIDIRIGGSLVGFGEIVILEDSTGVRITDFWGEG
jgi:flagellar motor switch protein FliN/FliY